METLKKQLVIIGAGPGGYVAALHAAKKGVQVALIDELYIGGTCLNVGCIPTKALIHSTKIFYQALHSAELGIELENATFRLDQAVTHKDSVIVDLVKGIEFLLKKYQVEVILSKASFVNDHLIRVYQDGIEVLIEAQDIIIATGSSSRHLPVPGVDLEKVFDSTSLLNNKILMKDLTVIGGGIIGLEFAFMYAQIGVKVEVVEFLGQVLPMIDKDVTLRLHRYIKQLGINLNLNSGVTKIEQLEDGRMRTYYTQKDVLKYVDSDYVLEAVGRSPNLQSLALENTSIEHTKYGIIVDETMKTNVDHVYAIGDVTGKMQLAHVASHQAIVAVDHILGKVSSMKYDVVPSVIFTTPQIASVGFNEQQLTEKEIPYSVQKVPFSASGRSLVEGTSTGFIKYLVSENQEKILGATVFGDDAEHLISAITMMMTNHLSFEKIKETIFAHPTTQELIHESALGFLKEAIHFVE
ncbi:MAG: dihydrolipoyl dehydrogenase [Candidatus Izemoplasmatales bacterium]